MNKSLILTTSALICSVTAFAQEDLTFDDADDFSYKKEILQTSDPFLNKFYNIEKESFDVGGSTISDIEKEKITLKQNGYNFTEADYIKAIEAGDLQNVLRFLAAGMPISELDTYNNSTLYYALRGRQKEMFLTLVERGADIDYINSRSQNLLSLALEQNYDDMINFLIEETNINLLFIDHNAWSVMHYAIEAGKVETVFLLMNKAPELLNYKNKFGNTPLLLALDKAYKDKDASYIALSKMLLKETKYLNVTNAVGNTSLHIAAMIGDYDLVKYILELGANPNIKNAKGWRPIDFALEDKNYEMANMLRYYGAEL